MKSICLSIRPWLALCAGLAFSMSAGCTLGDPSQLDEAVDAGLEDSLDDSADDSLDPDDLEVGELQLRRMPRYQLPFPCGQVWTGRTYGSHSPRLAIDFNRTNDYGDTVVAAAAGRVTRAEHEGNTSYGLWVEIGHGNGHRTRYAHLSSKRVNVGDRVRRGEKIGEVGNSGGSYGSHLHFERRIHRGATVRRARFNGQVAHYFGTRSYRSRNCR